MTKTIVHLTYYVHRTLGGLVEGNPTGGTATTLIDTVRLKHPDDYFGGNGPVGTLWMTHQVAQGERMQYSRVSDFVQSSSTLTLLDTLSPAPTSGVTSDRYAVATGRYPLDFLIAKVNQALKEWGGIAIEDITSLDTAPNTIEYTLPIAEMDLREVWVRSPEANVPANPLHWVEIRDWHIQRGATFVASKLVFHHQPMENRDVKLVYVTPHPTLVLNFDETGVNDLPGFLNEQIPFEHIVARAAMLCVEDRLMGLTDKDPALLRQLDQLEKKYTQMRMDSPRRNPPRKPRMFVIQGFR